MGGGIERFVLGRNTVSVIQKGGGKRYYLLNVYE